MKENKNEELQSRRSFFKKAAQTTLPILVAVAMGPLLNACTPDEPDNGGGGSSSGCGKCNGSCYGKCDSTCKLKCSGGCKTGCLGKRSGNGGHL